MVSWGLKSLTTWTCSVRSLTYMTECSVFCLLSLRENSISPEGAQALAQALGTNNTLKHLEYVVERVWRDGGQREMCFFPCSAHHYGGLDPWHCHSS